MLKGEIIQQLYLSKEVNDAINKMEPADLREDLKSEMFAALCELPDEKIITMYNAGWLKFYLVRMMLNMVKSNRSGFHKKHRIKFYELSDIPQESVYETDFTASDIDKVICGLHRYEQEMLATYVQYGYNSSEVSRVTKIPRQSIDFTINNIRQKVKVSLRKSRNMQLILTKKITISVTRPLSHDEIMELIDHYNDSVDRRIKDVKSDGSQSFIKSYEPLKLVEVKEW